MAQPQNLRLRVGELIRFRPAVPGEEFSMVLRRHPAILLGPISMVAGGLAVAILATITGAPRQGPSLEFIWITWSVVLVWAVWKVLQWYVEYFVIASHQILPYSGLMRHKVSARSLIKVVDISLHRSIAGRFLGYGELRFESLSWAQPFWTLRYTPYPVQAFLEVYDRAALPPREVTISLG